MRILLIEDEAALARPLSEHLAADHHLVEWFAILEDAQAAGRSGTYDVILLDLHLPDGDGLGFLKSLRARRDATPVIILTARDKISDRIKGLTLETLIRRKSGIVPRESLEAAIYAYGDAVESNALEAHISRLRAKLGKDLIVTHRGLGYAISP